MFMSCWRQVKWFGRSNLKPKCYFSCHVTVLRKCFWVGDGCANWAKIAAAVRKTKDRKGDLMRTLKVVVSPILVMILCIYCGWWFQTWILFSMSYMGCHPSHWRTHIFQDGYCTTNQIGIVPCCWQDWNGIVKNYWHIYVLCCCLMMNFPVYMGGSIVMKVTPCNPHSWMV